MGLKCVAVRKDIFVADSLDVTWKYSLFKAGLIWCLICELVVGVVWFVWQFFLVAAWVGVGVFLGSGVCFLGGGKWPSCRPPDPPRLQNQRAGGWRKSALVQIWENVQKSLYGMKKWKQHFFFGIHCKILLIKLELILNKHSQQTHMDIDILMLNIDINMSTYWTRIEIDMKLQSKV